MGAPQTSNGERRDSEAKRVRNMGKFSKVSSVEVVVVGYLMLGAQNMVEAMMAHALEVLTLIMVVGRQS